MPNTDQHVGGDAVAELLAAIKAHLAGCAIGPVLKRDAAAPAPSSAIPTEPGRIMPYPPALEAAYEEAFRAIEHRRGRQMRTDEYACKARRSGYDAFYAALWNACSAMVIAAHPDAPWCDGQELPRVPEVQVVPFGPGSGKSTAAKAFASALTKASEANGYPLGCALLVHHVETADLAYRELEALLPGQVAVWTREHDADYGHRKPAFSVDDLQRYPVVIVTHEFFKGVRGVKARMFAREGTTIPRAVTFIDEKVNEIEVFDVTLSDITKVCEFIQKHEEPDEPLEFAAHTLLSFAMSKHFAPLGLETPRAAEWAGWEAAESVGWFTTQDAGRYARSQAARHPRIPFEEVFGFGRCMAEGRAFIVRKDEGKRGTHFVGYERGLPQVHGMVLLDATADIDGVSELCPWRQHANPLGECFSSLEVVHVQSIAKGTLARWLQKPAHRAAYVDHMLAVIRQQVAPGQRALLVCKKALVDAKDISRWSEHVKQFADGSTTEFAWDVEDRGLAASWWGGYGVGANDWREADVVLLFDDFFLPIRTLIATVQGLRGHNAVEGVLGGTRPGSKHPDVDALGRGHILRWLKQMALRGKAREFDAAGVCGTQKLVVTGDIVTLVANFQKLFPGARLRHEVTAADQDADHFDKLIFALMRLELDDTVPATMIGELMGVEWRKVSSDLRGKEAWGAVLRNLGWEYASRPGRAGSFFKRIEHVDGSKTDHSMGSDL